MAEKKDNADNVDNQPKSSPIKEQKAKVVRKQRIELMEHPTNPAKIKGKRMISISLLSSPLPECIFILIIWLHPALLPKSEQGGFLLSSWWSCFNNGYIFYFNPLQFQKQV
jgi:hypothetical protein